ADSCSSFSSAVSWSASLLEKFDAEESLSSFVPQAAKIKDIQKIIIEKRLRFLIGITYSSFSLSLSLSSSLFSLLSSLSASSFDSSLSESSSSSFSSSTSSFNSLSSFSISLILSSSKYGVYSTPLVLLFEDLHIKNSSTIASFNQRI